jgi:hypothetical protein
MSRASLPVWRAVKYKCAASLRARRSGRRSRFLLYSGMFQGLGDIRHPAALETCDFEVIGAGRPCLIVGDRARAIRRPGFVQGGIRIACRHNDKAEMRQRIIHREQGRFIAAMRRRRGAKHRACLAVQFALDPETAETVDIGLEFGRASASRIRSRRPIRRPRRSAGGGAHSSHRRLPPIPWPSPLSPDSRIPARGAGEPRRLAAPPPRQWPWRALRSRRCGNKKRSRR